MKTCTRIDTVSQADSDIFLRSIKMKLITTLALSILACLTAIAGNLYVAPYGNDTTGTGQISNPFRTPDKALSLVNPGDTIILRDGVYEKKTGWLLERSGTASQPITIRSQSGERATLRASEELTGWTSLGNGVYAAQATHSALPMVFVDGVPFQRVISDYYVGAPTCSNLPTTISAATDLLEKPGQFVAERLPGSNPWSTADDIFNIYLKVDGSLAGSEVQVSHASHVFAFGRKSDNYVRKANYINLEDLDLEHSAANGIDIFGDYITVRNCLVQKVRLDAIKGYTSYFDLDAKPALVPLSASTEVLIENSEITQFGRSGVAVDGGQFYDIIGNEIHHGLQLATVADFNTGMAVEVKMGAKNVVVEDNAIHDFLIGNAAVTLGGSSNYQGTALATCPAFEAEDVLYENNVFYNLSWHPIRSAGQSNAIVLYASAKNAWFFNNDVHNSNAETFVEVIKPVRQAPNAFTCSTNTSQDIFMANNNFYDATWETAFLSEYQSGTLNQFGNCINCINHPGPYTVGNAPSGPRAIIKPFAGLYENTCTFGNNETLQLTVFTSTLVEFDSVESINNTNQPLNVSWKLVNGTSYAALQDNFDGTAKAASLHPGTAWVTLTVTAVDGSTSKETILLNFVRPNTSR
jgi:hypothetical protein